MFYFEGLLGYCVSEPTRRAMPGEWVSVRYVLGSMDTGSYRSKSWGSYCKKEQSTVDRGGRTESVV